jgi:hypothetical protein
LMMRVSGEGLVFLMSGMGPMMRLMRAFPS